MLSLSHENQANIIEAEALNVHIADHVLRTCHRVCMDELIYKNVL